MRPRRVNCGTEGTAKHYGSAAGGQDAKYSSVLINGKRIGAKSSRT